MALQVQVFPLTGDIQNTNAGIFLQEAMTDMFMRGVSTCPDMIAILYFPDSYLLFCTDELNNPCGVFAVSILDWEDPQECWVNIAYTHPQHRRQGVFKTLLDYTVDTLPNLIETRYEVISFGVFSCNTTMQAVMRRCGCQPVRSALTEEAKVFSLMLDKEMRECTHC